MSNHLFDISQAQKWKWSQHFNYSFLCECITHFIIQSVGQNQHIMVQNQHTYGHVNSHNTTQPGVIPSQPTDASPFYTHHIIYFLTEGNIDRFMEWISKSVGKMNTISRDIRKLRQKLDRFLKCKLSIKMIYSADINILLQQWLDWSCFV